MEMGPYIFLLCQVTHVLNLTSTGTFHCRHKTFSLLVPETSPNRPTQLFQWLCNRMFLVRYLPWVVLPSTLGNGFWVSLDYIVAQWIPCQPVAYTLYDTSSQLLVGRVLGPSILDLGVVPAVHICPTYVLYSYLCFFPADSLLLQSSAIVNNSLY